MADHLEAVTRGEIKRLLINIPPRHMKSLAVCVFWPAWAWIDKPTVRWMFSSYALNLALRDAYKCRLVIDSDWYQACYGDRYQLLGDAKSSYNTDKGGGRISVSVGSSATRHGGDIIVVDDPINVSDADSLTVRETTLEWWDLTMSSRLNNPKTGAKVIIMQRVHEDDLSGHILRQGG